MKTSWKDGRKKKREGQTGEWLEGWVKRWSKRKE